MRISSLWDNKNHMKHYHFYTQEEYFQVVYLHNQDQNLYPNIHHYDNLAKVGEYDTCKQ